MSDPDLLVGIETGDDAAVYRISEDTAVISTVDFITPPVDDPVWFGRIAAANSLSDVYAMGGRPLTALNLLMFPAGTLDVGLMKEILKGGAEKVREAGAVMAGGHSVDDDEPKYGLAVTGIVSPEGILRNSGARLGDSLVITKPLGTGVLFNARRSGRLPWPQLEVILPEVAALNGKALDIALKHGPNACTDITGFGLLGHLLEMAKGSGNSIHIDYSRLPVYPNTLHMYKKGENTGSNVDNRGLAGRSLEIRTKLSKEQEEVLFDPQTSGGLVFSLPQEKADSLAAELKAAGISSEVIGEVKMPDNPNGPFLVVY